ncbi:MAG: alpha-L-arabinofuranosidase, partial [Prevotella sp.]|nr:alpha-L-arabinofuranosidase [Prevotella sp.]
GAEPLPVVSCGLACQYQNGNSGAKDAAHGYDAKAHIALADLEPYIQDALDLIEFANGSVDTKWGKLRAEMGHPEPFNLKMLGVGNEQWDYEDYPAYTERLAEFIKVLRKQHPEIKIVGTTGPDSEGWKFDILKPKMKEMKVDLVDEHFYRNEAWFLDNTNTLRYESYDRKGPKIFAGEYACHGSGKKWNHYEASILEAGFMTDFERNADVVHMTAYAPLLAHVDGWQWRPDLIWYNNLKTFKTTSYYVQQLYSMNKGTNMLSLTMGKQPVANLSGQDGLEASAVYDKADGSIIVKIANVSKQPQAVSVMLNGLKTASSAEVTTLHCTEMDAENSIDNPNKIAPKKSTLPVQMNGKTPVLTDELPAMSFKVYRIK